MSWRVAAQGKLTPVILRAAGEAHAARPALKRNHKLRPVNGICGLWTDALYGSALFPEFDETFANASSAGPSCSSCIKCARISSGTGLLTADTRSSRTVAKCYGLPNVRHHFSGGRGPLSVVPVCSAGQHLMVTSYANRTSPVVRGQVAARETSWASPHPPQPKRAAVAGGWRGR